MQSRQSGSGVLEILLVLVVVGAIAVGGLLVWQHQMKPSKSTAATVNTSQSSATHQDTSTTQPKPDTTKYITLSEWGIKAKADSKLTLRYKIDPTYPDNALFTSDELTTADSNAGCGIEPSDDGTGHTIYNHGGGVIGRRKPNELLYAKEIAPYTAEQYATDPKYADGRANITEVGDYYYFYYHEQGPCEDKDQLQEQTEDAVRNLLQSFQPI